MSRKLFLGVAAVSCFVYGASMVWLSGYQSGYDDGETRAWDRARNAFVASPPSWDTGDSVALQD
ncbi:MAG: hypothetical protein O2955_05410 [Planctomycetota bacterium]|nr:hypothetical protein [Planctomycetota bacterium]MDA1211930.1 hypothetical protein [Planctomycetota bacterium]